MWHLSGMHGQAADIPVTSKWLEWSWTFPLCPGSFEHVSRPFMVTRWGINWKGGSLHPGIPAVVILGTRHPRPQSWPWHRPNTACSWACGPIETSENMQTTAWEQFTPFWKWNTLLKLAVWSALHRLKRVGIQVQNPSFYMNSAHSTQPVRSGGISLGLNIVIILQQAHVCYIQLDRLCTLRCKFEVGPILRS